MRLPVAFLFPGQGSHYLGMGREFSENHATYQSALHPFADYARSHLGMSLAELMFGTTSPGRERPAHAAFSGVSIFAVSFAVAKTLTAEGLRPEALLGYSLGELTAVAFAEVAPVRFMLDGCVRTSNLLEEETPRTVMLAVLDRPENHRECWTDTDELHLASVNYDEGFVVVGTSTAVGRFQRRLGERGITHQLLDVHRGFHSPFIDPVRSRFLDLLSLPSALGPGNALGSPGLCSIYSSAYGRKLTHADLGPNYCWDVVRRLVDFRTAIDRMEDAGPWLYADVGPSGTLAAFVNQRLGPNSRSKAFAVIDRFGRNLANLERILRFAERSES